jgi:hypothetical protein
MDFLERMACRFLIWRFRVGYWNCETSDLDDFPLAGPLSDLVVSPSRCAGCRAKEAVTFLEGHINL